MVGNRGGLVSAQGRRAPDGDLGPQSFVRAFPKPERSKGGTGQRKASPVRRVNDDEASEQFKVAVSAMPCIRAGVFDHECHGEMQAMHVVAKQILKRKGLDALLWDIPNGVNGCKQAHTRHDNKVDRIPRTWLPAAAFLWALDYGLAADLERHWPGGPTKAALAKLAARYSRPCDLCGNEAGSAFRVIPNGVYTPSNLVSVGPSCKTLLAAKDQVARFKLLAIVHQDDTQAAYLLDDALAIYDKDVA